MTTHRRRRPPLRLELVAEGDVSEWPTCQRALLQIVARGLARVTDRDDVVLDLVTLEQATAEELAGGFLLVDDRRLLPMIAHALRRPDGP